jgi:hypothetical protein
MSRNAKRNYTRDHLAYLAARLMAEDGVQDYAAAKRKAARQAGVPDTKQLPDNREIEAALRAYQSLYQKDSQGDVLRRLRKRAVEVMELLDRFNPHLTGAVLTGTAGPHSDINLQLFADSEKELELFLLNANIDYHSATRRVQLGARTLTVPTFTFRVADAVVNATLFATGALRIAQKYKSDGRPMERARLSQVKLLR